MADGGNVALHEIDGNVVRLKLQGACGACPSSVMTMRMGIQRRLMDEIPEIAAVEAITDKEAGLKLEQQPSCHGQYHRPSSFDKRICNLSVKFCGTLMTVPCGWFVVHSCLE
uniref:NIF system FeS cluster assembly NifU C-terminal domain-containing protein n=1 Tax=Aegilops tauschii subsp. strangulata TaxID=200361 RepID=A0A453K7N1_AEGTS